MKTKKINKVIGSINLLSIETDYVSNEMVYRNVKGEGISREYTEEVLESFFKTGDLGKGRGDNTGLYIIRSAPLKEYDLFYPKKIEEPEESLEPERSFIVSEPFMRFFT
jgi:hypothetical protein